MAVHGECHVVTLVPPRDPITICLPHTYVWAGPVGIESGANNYFGPFTIPVFNYQSAAIVGVRYSIRTTSDSVTFEVLCDSGSGFAAVDASLTGLVATNVAATTYLTDFFDIQENFDFRIKPTAIGTDPDNFRCTFFVNYQLAQYSAS